MAFTFLAAVPAAMLAAMYMLERRGPGPLKARAAKSTLDNAIRRQRSF